MNSNPLNPQFFNRDRCRSSLIYKGVANGTFCNQGTGTPD